MLIFYSLCQVFRLEIRVKNVEQGFQYSRGVIFLGLSFVSGVESLITSQQSIQSLDFSALTQSRPDIKDSWNSKTTYVYTPCGRRAAGVRQACRL
jgi:hypothetical protein